MSSESDPTAPKWTETPAEVEVDRWARPVQPRAGVAIERVTRPVQPRAAARIEDATRPAETSAATTAGNARRRAADRAAVSAPASTETEGSAVTEGSAARAFDAPSAEPSRVAPSLRSPTKHDRALRPLEALPLSPGPRGTTPPSNEPPAWTPREEPFAVVTGLDDEFEELGRLEERMADVLERVLLEIGVEP